MPKSFPVLAALAMGLGITACQVVSPPDAFERAELAAPESWSASRTATAGVDDRWIDRFGDKALEEAVEEALAQNRDLLGAVARLDIARENASLAGVPLRPILNGNLNGRRTKQSFIGFPTGGRPGGGTTSSSLTNTFGVSLEASWEADLWGRLRAAASAAVGELEASEAEFRAARSSLAAQVAKAWFALAEARLQKALAEESMTSYEETETVIRDRFENGQDDGSADGAQLRLAMSDVASAKASVAGQEEVIARTQRQLEVLLGRHPSGALEGRASLPDPPPFPPAGLPSELLTRRPDIQAAERRFAAQGQRIREATLSVFPSLPLTGNVGTSTEELSEVLNSDFGVWSLAGSVVQPILTAGRLRAEKKKREVEERLALTNLQSVVLKAFAEVETALAVDRLLAERESALAEAVALATEATDEARANYRGGVGDVLVVLGAQARQLQAKSQHISVRRARLDNRIDLHLALGGDYRPAEE